MERRIITLLWQRSEQALAALAKEYGRRLMATALNILGSRLDAEESVNDTYLAVWNAIPPKKPEPLAGFVYKTGRNQALKRLRYERAQKRSAYEVSLEELEGCIPAPALEETVEARALGQAIDRFLDTLPPENRAIFLRRYWFGDPVRDIAAARHMTRNAVTLRLSRMRDQLRAHLEQEGYL